MAWTAVPSSSTGEGCIGGTGRELRNTQTPPNIDHIQLNMGSPQPLLTSKAFNTTLVALCLGPFIPPACYLTSKA